jgi:hypothetical protein
MLIESFKETQKRSCVRPWKTVNNEVRPATAHLLSNRSGANSEVRPAAAHLLSNRSGVVLMVVKPRPISVRAVVVMLSLRCCEIKFGVWSCVHQHRSVL